MSVSEVRIIDPLKHEGWNNWVAERRESTIFHSSNWAKLLSETYRYRPIYFMLSQMGVCKACLPIVEVNSFITGRRGVCLSFSDYCETIAESPEEFDLLLENVLEYGRTHGWRYVEFRGETNLRSEKPHKVFANHTVELTNNEMVMLARLRKSTARNIQKAIKEGVVIETNTDLQGVLSFYRLHCLTRKRQGIPPQPKKYFLNLYKYVIAENLGFTALAHYGDRNIAGVVCLGFGENAIYKYGASDEEFQSLRANNLLFWEAIKRCAREGFRSFSLGRTDLDNEGLLAFKNGWGGSRTVLNYYRYDFAASGFVCNRERNLEVYRNVLRKLPVNVLRMLGKLAYRHMG